MGRPARNERLDADICVRCTRPGAALRTAPRGGQPLHVCDVCYQLAGGHTSSDDDYTQLADYDPTASDRAAAEIWVHEAGMVNGWLMAHGVRWELLRWMHASARYLWWQQLASRPVPEDTRPCVEGREVWLDEVEQRLAQQDWQSRRLIKWRTVATALANACPREGGAITRNGCTYPELAAAADCSEDYIGDIVRWYVDQGLLAIKVPGTRKIRMEIPEDERPEETESRLARQAAEVARHRALAELVDEHDDEVVELAEFREQLGPRPEPARAPWIEVAQVYELRAPASSEPAVPHAAPRGDRTVVDIAGARQRRAQRGGHLPQSPVQPGRAAALSPSAEQKSEPSAFRFLRGTGPEASGVVDEGPATPGSHEEELDPRKGPKDSDQRVSRPVRAARRLLAGAEPSQGRTSTGQLPRQLCRGVAVTWLAVRIAPYVYDGWTDEQLVQQIAHRGGTHVFVPVDVANPRGWIVANLRLVDPKARPVAIADEVRDAVDEIELQNAVATADRRLKVQQHEDRRRQSAAAAQRRQQTIDECDRCDEYGWVLLDGAGPEVQCDHRPVDAAIDEQPLAAEPLTRAEAIATIRSAIGGRDELRQSLLDQAAAARDERGQDAGTGYRPRRHRRR